jgi:hypothetical protein
LVLGVYLLERETNGTRKKETNQKKTKVKHNQAIFENQKATLDDSSELLSSVVVPFLSALFSSA